jgi:hypothetical protein
MIDVYWRTLVDLRNNNRCFRRGDQGEQRDDIPANRQCLLFVATASFSD